MRWLILSCTIALGGCVTTTESGQPSQPAPTKTAAPKKPSKPTAAEVARFKQVVARVEPVAERVCRAQKKNINCDFKIVIDSRADAPPNAYQTLDKSGRPILGFTQSIIAEMRNSDELAFVLGHEASHHISGHIPQGQQNAMAGAILLGGLAALAGAGSGVIDAAVDVGATVGGRSYSKNFELEADSIGAVIAHEAGYDPVRGVEYFNRAPDPGNQFLGSHPPNAQRIETVRRVAASL